MRDLVTNFYNWIVDLVLGTITRGLTTIFQGMLDLATQSCDSFWQLPAITTLLNTATYIGIFLWGAGLVMLVMDCIDAYMEQKQYIGKSVIESMISGLAFAAVAPQICKFSIILCSNVVSALDLAATASDTNYQVAIAALAALPFLGEGIWVPLVILFGIIVCAVFFFVTLRRFGVMIIQCLSSPLYVIPITRGDNSILEGWIKQTASVVLTYFFQYFIFWFGWYCIIAYGTGGTLPAFGMWLSIPFIPRILDKYGLSANSSSLLMGAAQLGMMYKSLH